MAAFRKCSGGWQAIVRRGGVYESRTFDTKADAEEWAAELERKIRRNEHLDSKEAEETTLGAALDRYLVEAIPGKKGETQDRRRIAAWKRDDLSKKPLAKIKGTDLATWRDKRLAAGVSGGTVRRDLVILSHLFNLARKEWGMAGLANPVENIRQPSPGRARDRRLNTSPDKDGKTEEVRLLAACEASANPWLAPMVKLALATAMRQSELLALRWENIDLRRKVAHLDDTKNGERRDVPLSSVAVAVLGALPRSVNGRVLPVSVGRLNIQWRKAVAAAGLKDFHFHDLRHEATSRLFEKGLNPMEAASVTGHKTLAMLKRYTHLRAEDLAAKLG
ncbi:MAG: site-specific integrase [Magnetospirillum sp.]|nr:site-specific integrase [Magnetospirillum sp.]